MVSKFVDTCVTPLSPTGPLLLTVVPLMLTSGPQQERLPSENTAQSCPPAEIDKTPDRPMLTGIIEFDWRAGGTTAPQHCTSPPTMAQAC